MQFTATECTVGSDTMSRRDSAMTLSKLRHDIRNHLNSIKLTCALAQRQTRERTAQETIAEIDRSVARIDEMITRYLSDAEAARLLPTDPPQ